MAKKTLLQEGDVIELKPGMEVYTDLPRHFLYTNCEGDFKTDHGKTTIGEARKGFSTDFLAGKYIVVKTAFHGGGTGHGSHDVYPSGHHVYCQKVDSPSVKVDFYQTGSFTAMIPNIKPIGRAHATWTLESEKPKGDQK